MSARVVLLVTSPRLPAGLLTAAAWDLLRTYPVLAAGHTELTAALVASGVPVTVAPAQVEDLLAVAASSGVVVWLAGPTGDESLARDLGMRLAREPGLAELELMYGSWDPPGARLLDVVAVLDRLASPGGDPWKREQTHQTLAHFLLEEAYEAHDAIASGDLSAVREELGDVLLQVVLHARMAQDADPPWSVDDLAGELVEKLIRRNPHVFGDTRTTDVDEIMANWERIKRAEKDRTSAMDGIVLNQPALALATKIFSRATRTGISPPLAPTSPLPSEVEDEPALGAFLLAVTAAAHARGLDPEAALRAASLRLADEIRAAEGG